MTISRRILLGTNLLLVAALACSLPTFLPQGSPTELPTSSPQPETPAVLEDLPPQLLETVPATGEPLPPEGALTLYFDQAMDKASVESSLSIEPEVAVAVNWTDSRTLELQPSEPLERGAGYNLTIGTSARSAAGLSPQEPLTFSFETTGFFQVTQVQPQASSAGIATTSDVFASFSQPVVPLGETSGLPQPLRFDPPLPGSGEWVGTSLYVFHPEPAMPAGQTITATISPGLRSVTGAILSGSYSWTFSTGRPQLVSSAPSNNGRAVPLDSSIDLQFNQPLSRGSLEESFILRGPDGLPLPGTFEWSDDLSQATFTPLNLLNYDQDYLASFEGATGPAGSPLIGSTQLIFRTVPAPRVLMTYPSGGGIKPIGDSVRIGFSGPMSEASLFESLSIEPELESRSLYWVDSENQLYISGEFDPRTSYTIRIDPGAIDVYGTELGTAVNLSFTTTDFPPLVDFTRYEQLLSFVADGPQELELQARNVSDIAFDLYSVEQDQALIILQNSYPYFYEGQSAGELLRSWSESVSLPPNQTQTVRIPLAEDEPLATGFYLLQFDSDQDESAPRGRLLLLRNSEIIIKAAQDQLWLWGMNLTTGEPLDGPGIQLIDSSGDPLGVDGVFAEGMAQVSRPKMDSVYDSLYAVVGQPGDEDFGLVNWTWTYGAEPYQFGLRGASEAPEQRVYIYSDRPLYRAGQEVYFRGALRQIKDDAYALPGLSEVEAVLHSPQGQRLASRTLSVSEFGTFNGSFTLAPEAELGSYWIQVEDNSVNFDVAAYRKPEFEIEVTASKTDVILGEPLSAAIQADYYFGGPVVGAEVTWSARGVPYYPPDLPSSASFGTFESFFPGFFTFGTVLAQGTGVTDSQGKLFIEIPTELDEPEALTVTIEASIQEENQLPVSGQTETRFHPANLYFSAVPVRYSLRVDEPALLRVHARDLHGEALAAQTAQITVNRVHWNQVVAEDGQLEWESTETLVNRDTLVTEANGSVLLSFVPRAAGSYRIEVAGEDDEGNPAQSSTTVWVVGEAAGVWRSPPTNQLALIPDKGLYEPGETAQVLIPSPFAQTAKMWVTLERNSVLSSQVMDLPPEGMLLDLPLTSKYAPNAYLSIVAIEPADQQNPAQVAMGLARLTVSAESNRLQVELVASSEETAPGDTVTFELRARTADGEPARAEFSLALVDEALLSLAEPNSVDPFTSFYSERPLAVRTASSLGLSGEVGTDTEQALGLGGGGDGELRQFNLRQDFKDTAFWLPDLVTDSSGRASVSVSLPDNLTTWQMEARGLTADSLVGEELTSVRTSKPLLIRPQTPRFFTAGDRATVSALVNNNTTENLPVTVQLLASGAEILSTSQTEFTVDASGSSRVDWVLEVGDVPAVKLTFQVQGGGLDDSSTPTIGTAQDGGIPVLRYQAPFARTTSGWLTEAGSRTESVSLPATFDPSAGGLTLLLEPSVAATIEAALANLEQRPYQSSEHLASRVLLTSQILLSEADLRSRPALMDSLEQALQPLQSRQNFNGGWGWWEGSNSQPQLTAHVLRALEAAQAAGGLVSDSSLERARDYLLGGLIDPGFLDPEGLVATSYVIAALASSESVQPFVLQSWVNETDSLPLEAKSLIALSLAQQRPNDAALPALLSDLESAAARSGAGAYWQDDVSGFRLYGSNITTTAQALRALMELDPQSPTIEPGIRWLLQARDGEGAWRSSFDTTYAALTLLQWGNLTDAWRAEYEYDARLNGIELLQGTFSEADSDRQLRAQTSLSELTTEQPNALTVTRGQGRGRLSYQAQLAVFRPANEVPPISRGLSIERTYYFDDGACDLVDDLCTELESASAGDNLLVQLRIVAPDDVYHVVIEDHFPAGAEPIDPGLETSPTRPPLAARYLFDWIGWWFNRTEIDDEQVRLFADYLPSGTYSYTYRLHASLAGDYQVIPARASLEYFPDVYGQTAGMIFSIEP